MVEKGITNKRKFWIVFNIAITILLITTFYFKIIPIPVENMVGANNPDEYIFGGFYYVSWSEQLEFDNTPFVESYLLLMFVFYLGNYVFLGGKQ